MIRVNNLTKTFKTTRQHRKELKLSGNDSKVIIALDRVSFQCKPGEIFGLIGPNGAGKTTALRTVATLLKPTAGTVTVNGLDVVKHAQKIRQTIGFMTGQTALYDRLTPFEMVRYMADLNGMDRNSFEKRWKMLEDKLSMHAFAERRIGRLSTGMKQKVSIARTIIHDAPVMIFDEPTAGLDIMSARAIMDLIRSCREDGKTVIFSSHRMEEVRAICDRIAIIHEGALYYNDTLKKFEKNRTEKTFEDEFIKLVEGRT